MDHIDPAKTKAILQCLRKHCCQLLGRVNNGKEW